MRFKRMIAMLLVALTICLAGCSNDPDIGDSTNKEDDPVEITLTQRQKDILEEMGLPADYDALSLSQKSAIESIETMLTHLEQEYAEKFVYLGYVAGGAVDKEHLLAYPASGTEADVVTLYRSYVNGSYVYEDDYAIVRAKPLFENALSSYVGEYFDSSDVKLFASILDVQGTVTQENVLKAVSATAYVFVDESACPSDQLDAFVAATKQWLSDNCNGMPGNVHILVTRSGELDGIFQSNYKDKLREDIFTAEVECAVTASGTVSEY